MGLALASGTSARMTHASAYALGLVFFPAAFGTQPPCKKKQLFFRTTCWESVAPRTAGPNHQTHDEVVFNHPAPAQPVGDGSLGGEPPQMGDMRHPKQSNGCRCQRLSLCTIDNCYGVGPSGPFHPAGARHSAKWVPKSYPSLLLSTMQTQRSRGRSKAVFLSGSPQPRASLCPLTLTASQAPVTQAELRE